MKYKAVSIQEYLKYRERIKMPEFWAEWAQKLQWVKAPSAAFDGRRWFPGGALNASANVLDKHKGTFVWDKPGLIFETEEGETRAYTYSDLHKMTEDFAGRLAGLGVGPGDYVLIYSPPLPEALAFAWAAARIGAPFEWVFTGWGPGFLASRIAADKPKVIIAADAFPRRGRPVKVKEAVDKAVEAAGWEGNVVVLRRMGIDVPRTKRDLEVEEAPSAGRPEPYAAASEHPLFALPATYDEGSDGSIVHGTAGYLVQTYATTLWMGLRPRDTYFCTVLPGWITGITYVLFGPFMVGSTVVVYEGGPDYPHWDRWWNIIERYAVTVFLTTPGALRLLAKAGAAPKEAHALDSLRLVLTTAEPMDEELWRWAYEAAASGEVATYSYDPKYGRGRIPVIHFYITREVGTFFSGDLPDLIFTPIRPGTVGNPFPGFDLDVVDDEGRPIRGRPGHVVLRSPWPAMPVEAPEAYWRRWRGGVYYVGDWGVLTEDYYLTVLKRDDRVMKVNGYRISPGDIERAVSKLGYKAYVVAVPDPQRFQAPVVIVEGGGDPDAVRRAVRDGVGPIADPAAVLFVEEIDKALAEEAAAKGLEELKKAFGVGG
jgi:acetyl-CoA synthetase